jgi:hypothetical protein
VCAGAAVLGQRRLQGAAVRGVQRRAVRGPVVQMGRAPRRDGAVLAELQDEEQGRPQHAGRATGAQGAGRHQMQTRQPRHVHQRQVPGQLYLFLLSIQKICLCGLRLFQTKSYSGARTESFLNVYMHGIFVRSPSEIPMRNRMCGRRVAI